MGNRKKTRKLVRVTISVDPDDYALMEDSGKQEWFVYSSYDSSGYAGVSGATTKRKSNKYYSQ